MLTPQDLELALQWGLEKTDDEIGGEYAATDVSNLILVYGFMKELGIENIIPMNITMNDGILVSETYW
jgi:exopolyphosphatase / guanosine-5'-triphosphate,3'-diphosphate pyrophosphatase